MKSASGSGRVPRVPVTLSDKAAKTLQVIHDGDRRDLEHVTITPISMSGFVANMSVGFDMSSRSIVLQIFKTGSTTAEFGSCGLSTAAP